QHARQQRHPPLTHLVDPYRGRQTLMVVDERLAGKQTGGVSVGSDTAVDHIEARLLAGLQTEGALKEGTDFFGILVGGLVRLSFRGEPMEVFRRDTRPSAPTVAYT